MPGGIVDSLPTKAREVINRQFPEIPMGYIESAYARCQILRQHKPQPSADVRAALDNIAKQAACLYVTLGTLSEEARNQLWDALEPVGGLAFFEQANFMAQALMGLSRTAALEVETKSGAPETWKHSLVRSLANILEAHGRIADAKPKGDLCFLSHELMMAMGYEVKDIRSTVRDALAKTPPE